MRRFPILLILALLIGTAWAQNSYHEVQVVDERGEDVTDISSVEIYLPDTTTNATIYSDRNRQNAITIPMTTSSTNSTLSNGYFYWYGPDGYDFSITDGNNILTNANHRTRTSSEGTLVFPSYIQSISSTTYSDAQSITLGTSSDWVLNAGATANVLTFTPAADNSEVRIGVSGTSYNSDFNVYVGTALGLKLDAGVPSLTWDGGATTLNHNSNYNVGLCTGTSTGAVTIGSSTAGAISVDSTSTATYNSDGATSITTTDAGADITVNSILGRVIIEGEEDATDAVLITADGSTASTLRIFNDTGTGASATTESDASIQLQSDAGGVGVYTTGNVADAVRIETNGGASETITINNLQGTGADAITIAANAAGGDLNLDSVLGRIEIEAEEDTANAVYIIADGGTSTTLKIHNDTGTGDESILLASDVGGITVNAAAGSVDIEAVGADDGDIGINAGDDMTLTAGGNLTLAVTGTWSAGGAALTNVMISVEEITAETDTLLASESGKLVVGDYTGTQTITLPDAAAGLVFGFVDSSAAAGDDLVIDCGAADSIDGDSVGDAIESVTDALGQSVWLVAIDGTQWITFNMSGTWGQQ